MPPTDEFGGPQRVAEAAPQRLGLVGDLLLRTTHDAVLVTDPVPDATVTDTVFSDPLWTHALSIYWVDDWLSPGS